MMKEIGSIFPLYDSSSYDLRVNTNVLQDRTFVSFCREALYLIAEKELDNGSKILLPKYTCDTVIAPFSELGCDYVQYPINKDMTVDIPETKRIYASVHPDLMVIHPYFGMDLTEGEQDMLNEFYSQGCSIVMDLTQCLFSKMRLPFVKYYVGSIRKWFPIPDGAFLEGYSESKPMVSNSEIVGLQTKAMKLRAQYFDTGDTEKKKESIRLSHLVEELMTRPITPHSMSAMSKRLLSDVDINREQEVRMSNYRYLYNGLHNVKDVELIADISRVTTAPLFFPFRVKNISATQKKLAEQSIYARLIWETNDRILTIAIDSRYNHSDMDRVVSTLKK